MMNDEPIDLTVTRANLDRLRSDAIAESRLEIEAMYEKARDNFPCVETLSEAVQIERPRTIVASTPSGRSFVMPAVKPPDTWDLMEKTDGEPVEIRTGMSRADADLAQAAAMREYGPTVHFFLRRRPV